MSQTITQTRKQKQQGAPMPLPAQKSDEQSPVQSAPQKMPKPQPMPIAQQPIPVPAQSASPSQQQQPQQAQTQQQQPVIQSQDPSKARLMTNIQALMGPPSSVQRSSSAKRQGSTGATRRTENSGRRDRLPSLHFGNLPEQFYDLDLFKFIKQQGHRVHKAFVVQDKRTQKNCKYGYAQFLTADEAKACLEALNNTEISGKTITVSLQASSKPNPKANVFVRNLPPTVTQQELFELYKHYGPVTKCKLECYADGASRGFAYVQFDKETDASEAIKTTNGLDFQGKALEVFAHEKKTQKGENGFKTNNNIFVQGLPKGTDEAKLKDMFTDFGQISSALVQNADSEDTMANNGFVCFADAVDAQKAISDMHKKPVGNESESLRSYLLVQPHVPKRENDMTADKSRAPIQQNMKKCFDSNLFVRNIPTETSQAELDRVFGGCGTIISTKIKSKKNNAQLQHQSRFKHAFILYETVEMAQTAIRQLDQSRAFGLTPIEVEFWVSRVDLQQEREDRQKQEMKRLIQSGLNDLHASFGGAPPSRGRRGGQPIRGGRPVTGGPRPGQPRQKSNPKSKPFVYTPQQMIGQQPSAQAQNQQQAIPQVSQIQASSANMQQIQLPQLNQEHLAQVTDTEARKQLIGNAIYTVVQPLVGTHAGKITGMLLDEKVVDFNRLTTDQKYLNDLVFEAMRLLQTQPQQ